MNKIIFSLTAFVFSLPLFTVARTRNNDVPIIKMIKTTQGNRSKKEVKFYNCVEQYNWNYAIIESRLNLSLNACAMLSDPSNCNKGASSLFSIGMAGAALTEAMCLGIL
jgi:hypothetical protein